MEQSPIGSAVQDWFVGKDGQTSGPFTLDVLRGMALARTLAPSDLVWQAGMPEWVQAATVPGLVPASHVPPPIPPRPVSYAAPMPPSLDPLAQNPRVRWLIPVGRSGWAIAAGYCGLLSFLLVFAPLALLFGILAIVEIRRNPNTHGMGRAIFGLVMGALGSIALLVMIVAIMRR
jgi:hypothetical protein